MESQRLPRLWRSLVEDLHHSQTPVLLPVTLPCVADSGAGAAISLPHGSERLGRGRDTSRQSSLASDQALGLP